MTWQPELDELRRREAFAHQMGGADKVKRQHDGGRLTVRERIERLLDAGTFHELFPSWQAFWAARPDKDTLPEVAAPAPAEAFLKTLRKGASDPRIRVR